MCGSKGGKHPQRRGSGGRGPHTDKSSEDGGRAMVARQED